MMSFRMSLGALRILIVCVIDPFSDASQALVTTAVEVAAAGAAVAAMAACCC